MAAFPKELAAGVKSSARKRPDPVRAGRGGPGQEDENRLSMPLTAPRPRALHRAEDIGSALKGSVNVCQRQLVKEVLGPFVTEFVPNFGREGATSIQRGSNAGLLRDV